MQVRDMEQLVWCVLLVGMWSGCQMPPSATQHVSLGLTTQEKGGVCLQSQESRKAEAAPVSGSM